MGVSSRGWGLPWGCVVLETVQYREAVGEDEPRLTHHYVFGCVI